MSDMMITTEQAIAMIAELRSQIEALRNADASTISKEVKVKAVKESDGLKKNQKPSKPSTSRKYVLLDKALNTWGKVPKQQADIAAVLSSNMEVDVEYSEGEVFDFLTETAAAYPSIANSRQDPTYLFRYYRGLKNDGRHAGFIARDFIRVIE